MNYFFYRILEKTSVYRFQLITKAYDGWIKKNEKVLDIGCGRGTITKLLINYYSLQLQACDVKNYLIYQDIAFKEINKNKLPKFKYKFDAALLNDVLHHISKDEQTNLIKEALRIADKVLIFEMKPTYSAKIFDLILNKLHYGDLNIPLSFRNLLEWKSLFKKLDIKSKTKEINKPFWYPFSHIAFILEKK